MSQRPPVLDWANDFDHFNEQWVQDPHPIWDELRQQCPVAHTTRYQGVYFPSRYKDIKAVALNPEKFSSRRFLINEANLSDISIPPLNSDPPDHSAHRAVLMPYFKREAIQRYKPAVRAICRDLIESLTNRDSCDGVADYARKIPIRVLAMILGLDPHDGDRFRRWIHDTFVTGVTDADVALRTRTELQMFFANEAGKRRIDPTDDLISQLVEARLYEQPLAVSISLEP